MKSYTFSDMNRQSGEILDAALRGPVGLTKRGKERLVILPVSQFQAMVRRGTQAYTVENAPETVHSELMAGLEEILSEVGRDV
jgi:prevent-host-death family protein